MRFALVLLLFSSIITGAADRTKVKVYVDTERKAGRTPDIQTKFGAGLSGTDFSGLDLSGVDFSFCNLRDCNFHRSDLRKALFHNAKVYLAEFIESDLRGAEFISCTLDRCNFDKSDLRTAVGFGHKIIMDVSAKGANLSGLNLSRTELNDIDFTDANLTGCVLSHADVNSSNFTRTTLAGVVADGVFFLNTFGLSAKQIDLLEKTGAIASHKRMEELVKSGHSFKGKNLQRSQLAGFDLTGADFRDANLMHCTFARSNLQGAKFESADLTWTNFSGANLDTAHFDRAECFSTNFKDARLVRASFRSANLDYAHFDHSNVDGADFTGATVTQADFRTATGSSVPSLEILNDRSGITWHEFMRSLEKILINTLPWLGFFAVVITIICAVKMNRDRGETRWVKPVIGIYFISLGCAVFVAFTAMSALSEGGFIIMLGFLCAGPLISLFGIFIGIHHLDHGKKKPHWPSILFFTCAPLPHAGIIAFIGMVLASI